jgi:hypothetical protein
MGFKQLSGSDKVSGYGVGAFTPGFKGGRERCQIIVHCEPPKVVFYIF